MTIDIVYPESVSGSTNYSSEPPLGPIALFSSLPNHYKENVRFLDSTILTQKEIENAILDHKAFIVAISCTTYNYQNALKIAEIAKKNNSIVVFGGIHITHLRNTILAKIQKGIRPIDFLITGYGEQAFRELVLAIDNKRNLLNIPNLSFINKDGHIVINQEVNYINNSDLIDVPLDYSKIDFQKYSNNFKPYGKLSALKTPGSIFTQRGCSFTGSRKCSFCSIEQMNISRSADFYRQDLVNLISCYNVDHIRITDADFTFSYGHMSKIANVTVDAFDVTKKKPLLHCFARADEIDDKRISILKKMNIVSLLIGYESGNDRMLNAMNKHISREQNLEATLLLKKHEIEVICGGLVLGARGENEATLFDTLDFIEKLKEIGNTRSIMATPLIPLPGSLSFNNLLETLHKLDYSKFKELNKSDVFDLSELIQLWNHYECDVPVKRLLEVSAEISDLFPRGIQLIDMNNYK